MRKRTVYLLICDECLMPKEITPYIMMEYLQQEAVTHIYCDKCKKENALPIYLKKIVPDLLK